MYILNKLCSKSFCKCNVRKPFQFYSNNAILYPVPIRRVSTSDEYLLVPEVPVSCISPVPLATP